MKNLILILVLLPFLFSNLAAQIVDLNWAPDFKSKKFLFDRYEPFHLEDDAYYVLSADRKEAAILKFDLEHNFISHVDFRETQNGLPIAPQKVLRTKHNTYAYSTIYDKKSKQLNLYTSALQKGDFQQMEAKYSHPLKVSGAFSPGSVARFAAESIANISVYSNLLDLNISPDSTQIALVNTNSNSKLSSEKEIDVAVFDEHLNLIWDRKVRLDIKAFRYSDVQTMVGDDGAVYVLAKATLKLKERKKINNAIEYRLYKIEPDNMQEIALEITNENIITDVRMSISNETRKLNLAGFYADRLLGTDVHGVFYVEGSMENGFGKVAFQKFDKELLELFNTSRAIAKGAGLPAFSIRDQLRHANGDLSLFAEVNYVQSTGDEDDCGEEYHSYDILIPRFEASGTLKNIAYVQKAFSSSFEIASSFSFTSDSENTYLLFNYQKSRLDFDEEEKKCYSCTFTDLAIINNDGHLDSRTEVAKTKAADGLLYPVISKMNDDAFLILAKDLKLNSIGLLTVE